MDSMGQLYPITRTGHSLLNTWISPSSLYFHDLSSFFADVATTSSVSSLAAVCWRLTFTSSKPASHVDSSLCFPVVRLFSASAVHRLLKGRKYIIQFDRKNNKTPGRRLNSHQVRYYRAHCSRATRTFWLCWIFCMYASGFCDIALYFTIFHFSIEIRYVFLF